LPATDSNRTIRNAIFVPATSGLGEHGIRSTPERLSLTTILLQLLIADSESGKCRVLCFSPRRDLAIARMKVPDIKQVVDVWAEEFSSLSSQPNIQSVQVFEYRGAMMGCSNPHPHGQIWANQSIPDLLAQEIASFKEYWEGKQSSMLEDYLRSLCLSGISHQKPRQID